MNIQDVRLLFEYHSWANQRILAAAAQLTPEQLNAPNDHGWGSLGGTLVHIMDTEHGWRRLLNDENEPVDPIPERLPSIAWLRERWKKQTGRLWQYVNSLNDNDLRGRFTAEWVERTDHFLLWQCLVHAVNHGTQHRSECAALLTGFGYSPGDIDVTLFLSQRDGSA